MLPLTQNQKDIAALQQKSGVNQPGQNIWSSPDESVPRTQPAVPAPAPVAQPNYNLNGGQGAGTVTTDPITGKQTAFTPGAGNNNNGTPNGLPANTPPSGPTPITPNNPDGAAPGSEQAFIDQRRSEEQGTIDAIAQQFDSVLSGDQDQKSKDQSGANAAAVAAGLVGSPSGGDMVSSAGRTADKQIATDKANKGAAIAQVLQTIDAQAVKDYRDDAATAKTDSQTSIQNLAKSGVTATQFKAADPTRYAQLLQQSGMDDAEATFYWNAQQKSANQIQWQTPQKTNSGYFFYGVDPTTGQPVTQTVAADVGNYTTKITNDGSLLRYDASGNVQQYKNGQWVTPTQDNFGAAPSATKIVKDADGNSYSYDQNTGTLTPLTGSPSSSPADLSDSSFRTDRNNNPIAAAIATNSTGNEYTAALDAAGIKWEKGDAFSDNPDMSTIKIDGDPLEASRAILSNSDAIQKWYINHTGADILSQYGVKTGDDFKALDKTDQDAIIKGIYGNEQPGGKIFDSSSAVPSASNNYGLSDADYASAKNYAAGFDNGSTTSMSQVPKGLRDAVSAIRNDSGNTTALATRRNTLAANAIVSNYVNLPAYQLVAGGLPYLSRIDAAIKTPGSVSDQDLLDSLTKLNTGGNAISDAQVKLITDGQSFSDMASAFGNKFQNGGVLSDNQRQQIQSIAKAIFANYEKDYQPIYDQATKQLSDAGIPQADWTIPNLNSLSNQAQGIAPSNGSDANNPDPFGLLGGN